MARVHDLQQQLVAADGIDGSADVDAPTRFAAAFPRSVRIDARFEADLAKDWPDLELYDPTEVSAEQLTEAALAAEAAALAVSGVTCH